MPSTVFVVRKNRNVIGIKLGIGTDANGTPFEEVFFSDRVGSNIVANSDKYLFESTFVQQKVNVKNIKNTVSLGSSFHQLRDNDLIKLNVIPNVSVGIGKSFEVRLKRDPLKNYLLLDSISRQRSGIATDIVLSDHRLKTGDKINHISIASTFVVGLGNSDYFVSVIDDNTFNLCDSLENALANPPIVVDIVSMPGLTGVSTFTKINPSIVVEKNNNLVFDTSDSSLAGHKFKLYYDKEFKNEFVSTGSSAGFNIPVGIITEGSVGSKFTIGFGNSLPDKLYYNLNRLGAALTADNTVRDYSEIQFVKNIFNGTFKISNVGVSTFTFDSVSEPLRSIHNTTNCDELSYSTTSGIVTGSINSINIVTGGSNYKKLPSFVSVGTTTINDVNVLTKSTSIGNIKGTRIINEGFEYSSDPTLQPEALLPSFIQLRGSKGLSSVEVVNGGANYLTAPKLLVVDTETGVPFSDSIVNAILTGSSIGFVEVEQSPSGISVGNVDIVATDNTNGISIQSVESSIAGIAFTVSITKPALGF